ncbi:MAG: aminodeoxychorismate/anthranilate synthase component II [Deltaproteobacteria bacterium]|jgi:anthranilate synthase/aminodeoxychorismate synthase-like glutamine amidotransferase|nr:aminodeoxychorismate/anthranilate synthase component II [Deltaproteobacteria bacterium]MBT4525834.1 aminodeoxychorismate/anthranilate synthase component II [Deltaproteobacteria bacterium]
MILLIDNYDSFTYNLYQLIESLGGKTQVYQNDQITISEIKIIKPKKIIISPGPKTPEDSGICKQLIREFYQEIPILGVCLGHQCLGSVFGANVIRAKRQIHGKSSHIFHKNLGIFKNIPTPFQAARYHSLVIDHLPKDFVLTAQDKNDEIMAIQHNKLPLFGVQFHPESFMTSHGPQLVANFLNV